VGSIGVGELLILGIIALIPILAFAAVMIAILVSGRRRKEAQLLQCPACGSPLPTRLASCPVCGHGTGRP
jgi:hypothetical protein